MVILCIAVLSPLGSVAQDNNPFEVYHHSDIKSTSLTNSKNPSIDTLSTKILDSVSENSVDVVIEKTNKSDRFNNPFEVEHIPILKKDLEQQKPRQQSAKKETKKEERISLNVSKSHQRTSIVGNFIFWLIVCSLLLMAFIVNLKRKAFVNLYKALTNDNYLNLIQREENNGLSIYFILLYFLFFINAALFLYLIPIWDSLALPKFFYMLLLGSVAGLYLIRHIFMHLLGWIFPFKKEIKQYDFTIKIFNVLFGIFLIPLNILIAYSPFGIIGFYTVFVVFIALIALRSIRGIFIAMRIRDISLFHFFIYLCTCEIAPLAIAIKLIAERLAIF